MKKKRIYTVAVIVLIIAIIIVASSVYVIKQQRRTLEETKILAEKKEEQTETPKDINNEEQAKALPTIPESWDQTKVTPVLSADNKYVPVPVGFTASKAEGEQEVDHGFVIYEGEVTAVNPNAWTEEEAWQASLDKNQFVWIPVENASERIYERNSTTGKIKARLWNFTRTSRSMRSNGNTDTKYEPGVLSNQANDGIRYMSNPSYGRTPGYSKDILYKELETEYTNTIKSIEKYGGFYIGRYETGAINTSTPVVKRMNTTISNQSWYTMYPRMRNISNNANIQTSMIWGCLWDETLQWLIDTGSKTNADMINSTSWGNYNNSTFTYKTNTSGGTGTKNQNRSTRIPTGSTEYTKANNIYDLAGNVSDWTLEGNGSDDRCYRGGYSGGYGAYYPAHYRNYSYPSYCDVDIGFRAYLYVK